LRRAATYVGGFLALLVAVMAMAWSAMRPGVTPGDEVFAAAWEAVAQPADRIGRWFATAGDVHPDWQDAAYDVFDGDALSGRALLVNYGCGACHRIPGIAGADGSVGPALAGLRQRAYIGGVLPNEPGGLVRWIVDPTVHSPNTAMPDLGVTEAEARDMAAYLYTLRGRP
jgi:cytochrome c2